MCPMKLEITKQRLINARKRINSLRNCLYAMRKRERRLKEQNTRLRDELFLAKRKIKYLEFTGGEYINDSRTRKSKRVHGEVQAIHR